MDNQKEQTPITPESVLVSVEAMANTMFDRVSDELARSATEFDRRSADFDRQLKQSREDFDRRSVDFDRRMKKLSEQIGGMSNNHGLFAEEYFMNAFEHGKKTFFGEKFDRCKKNVPGLRYEDEYDIVMLNGQSVGIVEVKYWVHDKDISQLITKVNSFKINFPEYHHHRFYLALASLVFANKVENDCIEQGIAVIKQVGDTVVINDENLKVF